MKKALSIILCFVLILSAIPFTFASADVVTDYDLNNAANWATYNSKNTTSSWWTPPSSATYNGKQAIKIVSYNLLVSATQFTVTPNTDYLISFAYCGGPTSGNVFNSVGISTLQNGAVTYIKSGDIYASSAMGAATDWTTVSFSFNSGNNTQLEFYAYPAGSSSTPDVYLADFSLQKASALNNAANWTVLRPAGTVIEWMTPTATTATRNGATINAIAFKGNKGGSYVTSFDTAKNHLYRLSFDYYSEVIGLFGEQQPAAVIGGLGVAPLKDGNVVFRTHSTLDPASIFTIAAPYAWEGPYDSPNKVTDSTLNLAIETPSADNWYSVSFEFNAGDNEALEFFINPTSLTGNAVFKVANFVLEDKGLVYSAENIAADSALYNTYGPADYDDTLGGFALSYIGSGIEFTANDCTTASVSVKLPSLSGYKKYSADSAAVTKFHTLRLKLWIDGVAKNDIIINETYPTTKNITIATGLDKGNHTFKLVRATEVTVGKNLSINGVLTDGNLAATEKQNRPYIEVYGDSVSSGYGNIASGKYSNFNQDPSLYDYVKDGFLVDSSTEGAKKNINTSEFNFEDGTKTYAYLAAEKLGADIGVFSKSGLGITVYGGKAEESTVTMSKWYPELPVNKNADYIIINHITNDSKYYNSAAGLTKEGLADAYADFIATVRADHANAKIVVVYGMMPMTSADEDYYLTGEEVILKAVAKAKLTDNNVYALMLPAGKSGGAGHPNEAEQISASNLLAEFIGGLNTVTTHNLAGIRAESNGLKQGIRVKNSLSLKEFENKNIVTYGAIATRKARLARGEAFTLDTEAKVVGIAYNTDEESGFDLVATPILRQQTEDENIFSAVLINIPQTYYDDLYLVRSFAIDVNGNIYYGEVTELSVFDVVYSILSSGSADDKVTANSVVNEIIAADQSDEADLITTYAQWCQNNNLIDNSEVAK